MNKDENLTEQKMKIVWESDLISIDYRQSPGKALVGNRNQFVDPTVWRIKPAQLNGSNTTNNGRILLLDAGSKVSAETVRKLIAGNGLRLGGLFELCHFVPIFKADVCFRKGEHFIVALQDSLGVSEHDRFFSSLLGSHMSYSIGVTYEYVLGKYDALFLGFKPED